MPPSPPDLLAAQEATRLVELEGIIGGGIRAFYEVGRALMEIRESRLYRATHGSFQDYCRDRWGLSRPEAYRAIDSARVVEVLSPIGDAPANEGQARLRLHPRPFAQAARVPVWRELRAEHGDGVTAAKVRQVVARRLVGLGVQARRDSPSQPGSPQRADEWFHYVDASLNELGSQLRYWQRVVGRSRPEHYEVLRPPDARRRLKTVEQVLDDLRTAEVGLRAMLQPLEYRGATPHLRHGDQGTSLRYQNEP
jgi:hypothetical protein